MVLTGHWSPICVVELQWKSKLKTVAEQGHLGLTTSLISKGDGLHYVHLLYILYIGCRSLLQLKKCLINQKTAM